MVRGPEDPLPETPPPPDEGEHMLLERIYDEDLAQASYLIGCQA
ncbi:hypothetical protein RCH07_003850, partial [Arthrobacter sp. CG_A4]|nr:hypothetical protein [Arthrobacter sp. CG_A4]